MKIISTNFRGLKKIKGINYSDKRGYFREIFKNNFFEKKKQYSAVYQNQKKM